MRKATNEHRTDRDFEAGDWVYLMLQPFKQTSLSMHTNRKLASQFYGPCKVIEKVGQVAYKLELPAYSKPWNFEFLLCQLKFLSSCSK